MAFLNAASTSLPGSRTYLEAVARVVQATGQIPPANLSPESPEHVQRAMVAVEDAFVRIYNAAFWNFRRSHGWLEIEDEVAAYQLPDDFAARGGNIIQMSDPELVDTDGKHLPHGAIRYVDYETLLRIAPEYRFSARGFAGGLTEINRNKRWIRENAGGAPELFSIYGTTLFLYPIISFVAGLPPNWSNEVPVLFPYYRRAPSLAEDGDVVELPHNLAPAHHFLSLAYYKQSQEYGDFQADEQRGERHLAEQITAMNAVTGDLDTAFADGLIG